jgi:organic radical activating enzyme
MKHTKIIWRWDELKHYKRILLTGGEPMEDPKILWEAINWFTETSINRNWHELFLYTARYDSKVLTDKMMEKLDGVHYSLHYISNNEPEQRKAIELFHKFQDHAAVWREKKSFRAFIDYRVNALVRINPVIWERVEVKAWQKQAELLEIQPKGIPAGEEMFLYGGRRDAP